MDEHVHEDVCPCGCCPSYLVQCKLSDKEVRGEVGYVYSEDDDDDSIVAGSESLLDGADEEREFIHRHDKKKATFVAELDCARDSKCWHDLDLQLNHEACCLQHDPDTLGLLKVIKNKVTYVRKGGQPGYFNNKDEWESYGALGSLLARSSYERRVDFCRCGYRRDDGMRSSCNDVLFCPRCGFHRRTGPMLAEFGNHFSADLQAFFVTLMPVHEADHATRLTYRDFERGDWKRMATQGLVEPFQHRGLGYMDYAIDCIAYAKIFRRVIQKAIKKGYISGAIGSFEIAVRFLPTRIFPHCHLIVFSRCFCLQYAQEMRRWFKQFIRNSRTIERKLHPDVSVLQLKDSTDYRRALAYCFKRIKLMHAYAFAAEMGNYEKGHMEMLNIQLNMVFVTVLNVFKEIENPVYRFGICLPRRHDYCFTVTKERKKKRKAEAKRRKEKKEREEVEARELGAPLRRKRRRTTEQSRQRRRDKVEYTRFLETNPVTQLPAAPPRPLGRRKVSTGKSNAASTAVKNSVDPAHGLLPGRPSIAQAARAKTSAMPIEKKGKLLAAIKQLGERQRRIQPPTTTAPCTPPKVVHTIQTPALASQNVPCSHLDEY